MGGSLSPPFTHRGGGKNRGGIDFSLITQGVAVRPISRASTSRCDEWGNFNGGWGPGDTGSPYLGLLLHFMEAGTRVFRYTKFTFF